MRWTGPYTDPMFYEIEHLLDEIHRKLLGMHEPAAAGAERILESVQQKISNIGVETHDAGDKYIIIVELPGFKKDDIKIHAGPDFIEITAHRKSKEIEGIKISERTIKRKKKLPDEIVPTKVKAHFNNGILEITAPKTRTTNIHEVPVE